jgi:hypothetical protein
MLSHGAQKEAIINGTANGVSKASTKLEAWRRESSISGCPVALCTRTLITTSTLQGRA